MKATNPNISPTTQLKRLVNQRAHSFSLAEFSRIRKSIEEILAEHQNQQGLSTEALIVWFKELDDAELKRLADF